MPYCQLTPCLDRGIIVLHTRLCVPESCDKAVYDPSKGILVLQSTGGSLIHLLRPSVCLRHRRREIPREAESYTVSVGFLQVQGDLYRSLNTFVSSGTPCDRSIKTGTGIFLDDHGNVSGETSIASLKPCANESVGSESAIDSAAVTHWFEDSNSNETALATVSRLALLFGEAHQAAYAASPTVEGSSAVFQDESFLVGFHGFEIVRYCLEAIFSRRVDKVSLYLTWRIQIYTKNIKHIELKLAAIRGSDISASVSKCKLFVLRCKRCSHVVERVDNATLVPLPSEFYTSTTGSTFCEECEPHLTTNAPALARSSSIIYQGEDAVTLYKPGSSHPSTKDRTKRCESCDYPLGNFTDCTKDFICYRKSCVGGFYGDSTGDAFWRYSPEIESIESLQYDERMRLVIGTDSPGSAELSDLSDWASAKISSSKDSFCIEIIKVAPQPDTFVISNNNVFEACRILWRKLRRTEVTLNIKLPLGHFEHLVGVLTYFSREADSIPGYIPSLLIAL